MNIKQLYTWKVSQIDKHPDVGFNYSGEIFRATIPRAFEIKQLYEDRLRTNGDLHTQVLLKRIKNKGKLT